MIVQWRWAFLALFFAIVGGALYLVVRNGVFLPVEFEEQTVTLSAMIYKEYHGPYHKILSTLNEVETFAKALGADCTQSFGEFVDDPNVVEPERLRANVGCLVAESVVKSSAFLSQSATSQILSRVPASRSYLKARFKGSPALGPVKVYSKLDQELNARHLASDGAPIEIYKALPGGIFETDYMIPVKPALNP